MLNALRRPLPIPWLIAGSLCAALAVALYCMAYTALLGRGETFGQALGWALANVSPWLLAIEFAKRARDWLAAVALLGAALAVSMLVGFATGASAAGAAFELLRRLPALGAAALVTVVLRSRVGQKPACQQIKLLPRQIDWVRAAGNYVEVRAGGRIVVQRASIGALERDLTKHGFVRIHRSLLVRRDRIARVRAEDVVLVDGTHLKLGKRYRTRLAA